MVIPVTNKNLLFANNKPDLCNSSLKFKINQLTP